MAFRSNIKILTGAEINDLDLTKKEDKDKLILSFVSIASNIASHYSRLPEIDYDDIQAEAILGIVDAIDRVAKGKVEHNNIGGYVNKYIHQYCFKFLKKFSRYRESVVIEQLITDSESNSSFDFLAFNDCLDTIVKTSNERRVLELRKEGFNDTEIQGFTGLSRPTIGKIRSTLFNRFKQLWI